MANCLEGIYATFDCFMQLAGLKKIVEARWLCFVLISDRLPRAGSWRSTV